MSSHKPRIVFLNRSYWPDTEATGQLLEDLCEHLSPSFDVHVVCGQPNSPRVEHYKRSGIESRGGVTVHRLEHRKFAKRFPAGRLINLISFTHAADRYLRRNRISADVLISETDPFLLPIVAANHSRRVGCKFVSYLQDIYPDVAEEIGKVSTGWLTRRIRSKLRAAYASADHIVVLGRCMRDRLHREPWSLDTEKVSVIPNWSDCELIRPLDRNQNAFLRHQGLEDRFVIMHSGNMGLTQRLDVLVRATRDSSWPASAVLVLVGDGAAKQELQIIAGETTDDRVRFLPYQPREELSQSLSAADLHVVSMHENISGCLCPSKLYGILAAGRPVLAIADQSTDLCQTVNENDLGWCCQPGDARAIAQTVAVAASNTTARLAAGERARCVACQRFDRKVVVAQFSELLNECLR